jgi:hypothetical protein
MVQRRSRRKTPAKSKRISRSQSTKRKSQKRQSRKRVSRKRTKKIKGGNDTPEHRIFLQRHGIGNDEPYRKSPYSNITVDDILASNNNIAILKPNIKKGVLIHSALSHEKDINCIDGIKNKTSISIFVPPTIVNKPHYSSIETEFASFFDNATYTENNNYKIPDNIIVLRVDPSRTYVESILAKPEDKPVSRKTLEEYLEIVSDNKKQVAAYYSSVASYKLPSDEFLSLSFEEKLNRGKEIQKNLNKRIVTNAKTYAKRVNTLMSTDKFIDQVPKAEWQEYERSIYPKIIGDHNIARIYIDNSILKPEMFVACTKK